MFRAPQPVLFHNRILRDRRHRKATALLVLLCFLAAHFSTPSNARIVGRVVKIRPSVEAQLTSKQPWHGTHEGTFMRHGQVFKADGKGAAVLQFNNGTIIELKHNSTVQVEPYEVKGKALVVRVIGAFSTIFVKAKGPTIIRNAACTAAVVGTGFLFEAPTENSATLTVTEGAVRFYNSHGQQLVTANQQSSATTATPPTKPVAVDVTGLLQWTADASALPLEFETPLAVTSPNATVAAAAPVYNRGQFSQALQILESQTLKNLTDADFWIALGHARRETLDSTGALAAYQQALQLAPARSEPIAGIALTQLAQNKLDEASQTIGGAPNRDTDALLLALRGLALLRRGNSQEAITALQNAENRDKKLFQASSLLSLSFLSQNDVKNALESAKRAVTNNPRSAQAQGTLAMALFFNGQTREATISASRAVEANPFSAFAQLSYGRSLLAQGQLDEAANALGKAEELSPNLPIILNDLGAAFMQLDRPKSAARVYRRSLVAAPDSVVAQSGLGSVLAAQGHKEEAQPLLQKALAAAPDNIVVRANYTQFLIENGQFSEAENLLNGPKDRALENALPADGLRFIRLSESSLFQQRLFDAQQYARQAVKLLPSSARAHYQLGRVYLELERTQQAEQEFRQAVVLDSRFAPARFALGQVQEIAQSGRDLNNNFGTIGSNSSGPRQAFSIQNVQRAGAENRFQAATDDPTVIRTTTRSLGDTQIDGRLGNDDTFAGEISHIQETNERRGVVSGVVSRFQTDSPRHDTNNIDEKVGFSTGSKRTDSPSNSFYLFDWDRSRYGGDTAFKSVPTFATNRINKQVPFALASYKLQKSANSQLRLLLAADQPSQYISDKDNILDTNGGSWHTELRYDTVLASRHYLSSGLLAGRRNFGVDVSFHNPIFGDLLLKSRNTVELAQFFLRDELRLSDKLRLTGELRFLRQEERQHRFQSSIPAGPPTFNRTTRGLPRVVLDYLPKRTDTLRFRAESQIATIRDFQFLSPTEVFLSETENIDANLGSGFRTFEAEWTHTFHNASFLRIGAWQKEATRSSLGQDKLQDVRIRKLQLRYEGFLDNRTSYFFSSEAISATSVFDTVDLGGPVLHNYRPSFVPHFSTSLGLQYLSAKGWFVQPNLTYIGDYATGLSDPNLPPSKQRGYAVGNLRFGKRQGLRSSLFVEISNIFDKSYAQPSDRFLGGELPSGRQIRFGFTHRH